MDYQTAFAISGSGMSVERLRLDVTAVNIANVNTTRTLDGGVFRPLRVISGMAAPEKFQATLDGLRAQVGGVEVLEIRDLDVTERLVFEPSHPDADAKGFVHYPGINLAAEMVEMISAVRTYDANVAAMNAAKTMALRALDIGGNR